MNSTVPATGLKVVLSNKHGPALANQLSPEAYFAPTYSTRSALDTPEDLWE